MTHCRPLLFQTIRLRSPEDIYNLRIILTSATSGWLREHIHTIILGHPTAGISVDAEHSLLLSCPALAGQLPQLSNVQYNGNTNKADSPVVRNIFRRLPYAIRVTWRNVFPTIKSITLQDCNLYSAMSLMRILGALPRLEDAVLINIHFKIAHESSKALLKCGADFSSINTASLKEWRKDSETWPLAWMFASACIGYRSQYSKDDLGTDSLKDALAAVDILKILSQETSPVEDFEIKSADLKKGSRQDASGRGE